MRPNGSDPRVSLGLPVFNGEAFLTSALDSIARQTYRDFELLILDNASTDRTEEIARGFVAGHAFARYERHDRNLGASENFNQAFRRTSGELFKWIAADDLIDPRFLELCVSSYDQAPEEVVNVFPRRRFIDPTGAWLRDCTFRPERRRMLGEREIRVLDYREQVRLPNQAAPAIVFGLMRRSALRRTRLIGAHRAADLVLNAELCLLGEQWQIPELLWSTRRHASDSWRVRLTKKEQARWYAPHAAGGTHFPQVRLLIEYVRSVWNLVPEWDVRAARLFDLLGFVEVRTRRTLLAGVFSGLRGLRLALLRRSGARALAARGWLFLRALARIPRNRSPETLSRPWSVPTPHVLAEVLAPLVVARRPEALALLEEWRSAEACTPDQVRAAEIIVRETDVEDAAPVGAHP